MYETPDVPETISDYYEDNDAECIERLHISSQEAANKFKGKYLTGHIDYSYNDVRGGCWELAAQGEKESPIEKYRRIKCEIDELMNEIVESNTSTAISKRDKESYESVSVAVSGAQKVLSSLRLENVLGIETVSAASDNEIKKLIAQVEDFRKNRTTSKVPIQTPSNHLEHTKRIAELEGRLHRVEGLVGSQQPKNVNRLTSVLDINGTLLDSVQQISTKAALLQPSQLDQIEARISALTTKLDAISEKSATLSGKKNTSDDKVTALYDIAKKTEPIAKLLPDMLHRMQALENLHKQGNQLSKHSTLKRTYIIKKLLLNQKRTFSLVHSCLLSNSFITYLPYQIAKITNTLFLLILQLITLQKLSMNWTQRKRYWYRL